MKHLRIGTRGSLLAKWQAEFVRKQVFQAAGVEGEIVIIKTTGDKMQQSSLSRNRRQGNLHQGTRRSAARRVHRHRRPQRERHSHRNSAQASRFPRSAAAKTSATASSPNNGATLANLRQGARVGTGSLRRQAQLRHVRPDLDVRDLRGNVDTRLRKVESGEYDAVMLAKAGLDRLGCDPSHQRNSFARSLHARCRPGRHRRRMPRRRTPKPPTCSRNSTTPKRAPRSSPNAPCCPPFKAAARFRSAPGPASSATNSSSTPASAPSTVMQYVKQRATAPPEQAARSGRAHGATPDRSRRAKHSRRSEPPTWLIAASDRRPRSPLAGKRVVITRAVAQSSELFERLLERGAIPDLSAARLVFGARTTTPRSTPPCVSWQEFDWVIFTSANAVQSVVTRAAASGVSLASSQANCHESPPSAPQPKKKPRKSGLVRRSCRQNASGRRSRRRTGRATARQNCLSSSQRPRQSRSARCLQQTRRAD